jgi:hypothetical protein
MNNIEATSFIKEALKEFILSFPKTRVRYEFDIDANVHCIEVVPNSIYHLDNDYINWENNFTNSFIQSFPYQNICFFSDDAIVGMYPFKNEDDMISKTPVSDELYKKAIKEVPSRQAKGWDGSVPYKASEE